MTTERMHIQGFYDPATGTISYVLADPQARQAAVIDAVLDLIPSPASSPPLRPIALPLTCMPKVGSCSGFWKLMPMLTTSRLRSTCATNWEASGHG
jgi:hypothetical protein